MYTVFEELDVDAIMAGSFSIFYLEGHVPQFADQHRQSLLLHGMNLRY